MTRKETKLIN